jgi:hypothetical protein
MCLIGGVMVVTETGGCRVGLHPRGSRSGAIMRSWTLITKASLCGMAWNKERPD